MKKALIIFLLFLQTVVYAQSLERQVVASGGNYSQSTGVSLSYTVGELAVTTLSASTILTQGFQQPDALSVGIINPESGKVSFLAYPNPVSKELQVEISTSKQREIYISIIDMLGRPALPHIEERFSSTESKIVRINTEALVPGMYFVQMLDKTSGKNLETLRIVKSHY
ncbi:MAG: T9SS C-terminal target domain-containing protein [Bacteroidetes bacterium]|nr:MAG: T9SS C-terminal target domain-containing protein [Bacteroidota bacterium]REK00777.1 MAG: T9SS C-terminal target domain-containing protein [Bacteroidota bacterium]REK35025.1 MAG: T9SS C-terminal target domain-containing protein [Bacteroidota bacterium]REK48176.1 MAG: T9SS C-terminal target domain-containing protein [Bacteroidota bacterium]